MAEAKRRSSIEKLKLLTEFRQLDEATQRKFIRYTISGIAIIIIGLIVIVAGIALGTGAYASEGLLIGLGALIVVIGIVRVLIGFIKPMSPTDLTDAISEREAEKELREELFEE